MKVVLDSNVIISALITQGLSSRLFDICIDKHVIFISAWILDEVTRILRTKFIVEHEKITRTKNFLLSTCVFIKPEGNIPTQFRDQDDNNILHIAETVKAEIIITGDEDLLILKEHLSTKIISPRIFMEKFNTN